MQKLRQIYHSLHSMNQSQMLKGQAKHSRENSDHTTHQIFNSSEEVNKFISDICTIMKQGKFRMALQKLFMFFKSSQKVSIDMFQTLQLIRRYFGCLRYLLRHQKSKTDHPSEEKMRSLYMVLSKATELLSEQKRIIVTLIVYLSNASEIELLTSFARLPEKPHFLSNQESSSLQKQQQSYQQNNQRTQQPHYHQQHHQQHQHLVAQFEQHGEHLSSVERHRKQQPSRTVVQNLAQVLRITQTEKELPMKQSIRDFQQSSLNNSFDDSLEETNKNSQSRSPVKDRKTSIHKTSMKDIIELAARNSKRDIISQNGGIPSSDKPFLPEYWKKKLIFKLNQLTQDLILNTLCLGENWTHYFKLKNEFTQYAACLRKSLDLVSQIKDCRDDQIKEQVISLKIELANFYVEQMDFSQASKIQEKVWEQITNQFSIKAARISKFEYFWSSGHQKSSKKSKTTNPEKMKEKVLTSFNEFIGKVMMVLETMAINEEYLGKYARMIECLNLQTWLGNNFFEGVNDNLLKHCQTNLKAAQKRYGELIEEEGEIRRVLMKVYDLRQERAAKMEFSEEKEWDFLSWVDNKMYKKFKIDKINESLVVLQKKQLPSSYSYAHLHRAYYPHQQVKSQQNATNSMQMNKEDLLDSSYGNNNLLLFHNGESRNRNNLSPEAKKYNSNINDLNSSTASQNSTNASIVAPANRKTTLSMFSDKSNPLLSSTAGYIPANSLSIGDVVKEEIAEEDDEVHDDDGSTLPPASPPLKILSQSLIIQTTSLVYQPDKQDYSQRMQQQLLSPLSDSSGNYSIGFNSDANGIRSASASAKNFKIRNATALSQAKNLSRSEENLGLQPRKVYSLMKPEDLLLPSKKVTSAFLKPSQENPTNKLKKRGSKEENQGDMGSETQQQKEKVKQPPPKPFVTLDKYFENYIDDDLKTLSNNFGFDFITVGIKGILSDEKRQKSEFDHVSGLVSSRVKHRNAMKASLVEDDDLNKGRVALHEKVYREFKDVKTGEDIRQYLLEKHEEVKEAERKVILSKIKLSIEPKQSMVSRFMNHREVLKLEGVFKKRMNQNNQDRILEQKQSKRSTSAQKQHNYHPQKRTSTSPSDAPEIPTTEYYQSLAKKGINMVMETTVEDIMNCDKELQKAGKGVHVNECVSQRFEAARRNQGHSSEAGSPTSSLARNFLLNPNQQQLGWDSTICEKLPLNQLAESCRLLNAKEVAKKISTIGDLACLAIRVRRSSGIIAAQSLFTGGAMSEIKKSKKKAIHKNINAMIWS